MTQILPVGSLGGAEHSRRRADAFEVARVWIIAVTVLAASACAGSGGGDRVVDIAGVQVPARITIASASVGGAYYPMGNAIAQTLNEALPGIVVLNEATSGSSQNLRMLNARQIHFGLSNASITFPALRGAEGFGTPIPVRAVISLHSSVNLFIALKGSGIARIADLQGKRVSLGPAGGGWDYYTRPILAAHGVDYSDFRQVYEGQSSAIDRLTDGSFDAVFVGGSIPHATILAATASHELEYVEFDESTLDGLTVDYPFIRKYKIPANTYRGQDGDFWAVDAGTAQLLTRADAPSEFVYLITKTIYENRARIEELHRAGAEITPERAAMDIGIPYHEGSLRYFSEIGLWPANPESVPSDNE